MNIKILQKRKKAKEKQKRKALTIYIMKVILFYLVMTLKAREKLWHYVTLGKGVRREPKHNVHFEKGFRLKSTYRTNNGLPINLKMKKEIFFFFHLIRKGAEIASDDKGHYFHFYFHTFRPFLSIQFAKFLCV